jgi:hypothetical protein
MASNYNSRTRPVEVLIKESGYVKVLKRRESFDDMIKNEV